MPIVEAIQQLVAWLEECIALVATIEVSARTIQMDEQTLEQIAQPEGAANMQH